MTVTTSQSLPQTTPPDRQYPYATRRLGRRTRRLISTDNILTRRVTSSSRLPSRSDAPILSHQRVISRQVRAQPDGLARHARVRGARQPRAGRPPPWRVQRDGRRDRDRRPLRRQDGRRRRPARARARVRGAGGARHADPGRGRAVPAAERGPPRRGVRLRRRRLARVRAGHDRRDDGRGRVDDAFRAQRDARRRRRLRGARAQAALEFVARAGACVRVCVCVRVCACVCVCMCCFVTRAWPRCVCRQRVDDARPALCVC